MSTSKKTTEVVLPNGQIGRAGETVELPWGGTSDPLPTTLNLHTPRSYANSTRRMDQWLIEHMERGLRARGMAVWGVPTNVNDITPSDRELIDIIWNQ